MAEEEITALVERLNRETPSEGQTLWEYETGILHKMNRLSTVANNLWYWGCGKVFLGAKEAPGKYELDEAPTQVEFARDHMGGRSKRTTLARAITIFTTYSPEHLMSLPDLGVTHLLEGAGIDDDSRMSVLKNAQEEIEAGTKVKSEAKAMITEAKEGCHEDPEQWPKPAQKEDTGEGPTQEAEQSDPGPTGGSPVEKPKPAGGGAAASSGRAAPSASAADSGSIAKIQASIAQAKRQCRNYGDTHGPDSLTPDDKKNLQALKEDLVFLSKQIEGLLTSGG